MTRPFLLTLSLVCAPVGAQSPEAEVRAAFEAFVSAQNAHDLKAVGTLLAEGPDFLWITRGTALWGREEALRRFEQLYAGTWRLEPDPKGFRTVRATADTVQIFVPIRFHMGPSGQPSQEASFLMNQVWIRTAAGWRLGSLLPIPVPPPPKP